MGSVTIPTDREIVGLVGHRFPGGTRTVEHWENWLLTDCTRRSPMPGGLLHPVVLFHVPIQAVGTSIAELFELGRSDGGPGSVTLLDYDWEYLQPMYEDAEYRAEGSIVDVRRHCADSGEVLFDDVAYSIEMTATDATQVARVTNRWRFRRSAPARHDSEPLAESGTPIPPLVVEHVATDRMKTMAALLRDPYPIHWDPEAARAAGHALLQEAGEPGPYVIVGHSFGGSEAVTFASSYPTEVRGLLLLDASPPTWNTAICAVPDDGSDTAQVFQDLCEQQSKPDNNVEHLDAPTAFGEVATITSLNALPLIVATADHHSYPGLAASEEVRLNDVWVAGQAHWVSLASTAQLISVSNTSHNIQLDRPDVVLDAIHVVVLARGAEELVIAHPTGLAQAVALEAPVPPVPSFHRDIPPQPDAAVERHDGHGGDARVVVASARQRVDGIESARGVLIDAGGRE